jgi:protein disulfide-isomerase
LAQLYFEVMLRGEKGGGMKRQGNRSEWRVAKGLVVGLAGLFLLCGCNQSASAADASGLWREDYDAALKQAAAENKSVLVDFSGSDWCGWCIKLEKEVFSQPEFTAYAKENLILVLVDFPNAKPQTEEQKTANQALAEKYGIQGFPTVLILNPQGKVVRRTGYQPGGAPAYVEMIQGALAP